MESTAYYAAYRAAFGAVEAGGDIEAAYEAATEAWGPHPDPAECIDRAVRVAFEKSRWLSSRMEFTSLKATEAAVAADVAVPVTE